MKMKKSNQTTVSVSRLIDFIQHSIDRLTDEVVSRKDIDDPVTKIESAYYDLLRRNARDVAMELGLLGKSGKRASRSVTPEAVRKAVSTVITANNVKRLELSTSIGRTIYDRAEECLRDGFQPFMS